MAHGRVTTNVPAELKSAATDGIVASADGIFDYNENKTQEELNKEFKENSGYVKPVGGIPKTDLSQELINEINSFITNTVNNLVNYYTKDESYTKSEITSLLNTIKQFTYEYVNTLPEPSSSTTNKIYLVPSEDSDENNIKDEYITILDNGSYRWELIGNTNIDLSGYLKTTDLGAWAKAPNKPTYTPEEIGAYSKPSSGIPNTDLASSVQSSLNKADNAQEKITTVTVNVDNNTGTPSGTATFNNNTLELSFSNLKGPKGDTGSAGAQGIQGATGPQGPKGDTGATGDTASLIMVQEVDETTSYTAATDVAGAAAAQKLMLDGIDDEEVVARALVELKSYQEDGYAFKGVITPDSGIGDQIQKVAYIAAPGTYTFTNNPIEIPNDCVGLIYWDGITWGYNYCPTYRKETIIDDFSNWEQGYQDASGTWYTNAAQNPGALFKYKRIKLFAGQTITIHSVGRGFDIVYLRTSDSTPLITETQPNNALGSWSYNSAKTDYYYVFVQTKIEPTPNAISPYIVLSYNTTSNIKIHNVVKFGKGENWEDVVSAKEFNDKNIVTEKDGEWLNGWMPNNHPVSANASLYKFTNDSYKYIYAKVKSINHTNFWALAFYSDEPFDDTLIESVQFVPSVTTQRHPMDGDFYVIKRKVPNDCKYIYVSAGNTNKIEDRTTKVYLFRDTSYVPLKFILDNFKVETTGTILNKVSNPAVNYNDYDKYVSIRNNFAKEGAWSMDAPNADFRCIFLSDIHADINAFDRIVNLTNKWTDDGTVDAMILTGDISYDKPTEDYTWFHKERARCNVDILTTPGNHDWNYAVTANQERTYNNVIAPMVNGITVNEGEESETVLGQVQNIVQPDDAAENFRLYYYKDYGNVRFIGIYTAVDSDVQLTWLEEILADAITNNKVVIIGNHSPFDSSIAPYKYESIAEFNEANLSTFYTLDGTIHNTSGSQLGYDTPIPTSYAAAVKTFMDNGGTFICWMTGHTHRDHFYDVTNHDTYGYQLMLNTNGAVTSSGAGDMVRFGTNGSSDCYNYVTVNTTQKLLKLLRIGCNVDAIGRGRTVFVYDYVNHKVVVNY